MPDDINQIIDLHQVICNLPLLHVLNHSSALVCHVSCLSFSVKIPGDNATSANEIGTYLYRINDTVNWCATHFLFQNLQMLLNHLNTCN